MPLVVRFIRAFSTTLHLSARVFRERAYQGIAAGGTLMFFCVYMFVPVWFVPGNTLAFELTQVTFLGYGLLIALALMTGALLSLEVFAFRRSRAHGMRAAGEGSVGLVASLTGGVLAAASCGCGTGILLGAIGLGGGAFFVAANQTIIVAVMLLVVAVGLYFSARRAAGICAVCRIPAQEHLLH